MPIYEYECSGCKHSFDEVQKMQDPPITVCPLCHQEKVIRLVSAAGFQLKGSGWYVTDFKDKGKPKSGSDSSTEPQKTVAETTQKITETTGGAD